MKNNEQQILDEIKSMMISIRQQIELLDAKMAELQKIASPADSAADPIDLDISSFDVVEVDDDLPFDEPEAVTETQPVAEPVTEPEPVVEPEPIAEPEPEPIVEEPAPEPVREAAPVETEEDLPAEAQPPEPEGTEPGGYRPGRLRGTEGVPAETPVICKGMRKTVSLSPYTGKNMKDGF